VEVTEPLAFAQEVQVQKPSLEYEAYSRTPMWSVKKRDWEQFVNSAETKPELVRGALPCPPLPSLALPCPPLPSLALPCPPLPSLALPCPPLPSLALASVPNLFRSTLRLSFGSLLYYLASLSSTAFTTVS
jgi:hypothetical protein